MKRLGCLVLAAVVLSGCASSRQVRQADGWLNHVVTCGGPFLAMSDCLERAGEICGSYGYTVLERVDESKDAPDGGGHYPKRRLRILCH